MSEDDVLENWQVQVRKGLLELCVLNALREGRKYGYDIVKQLGTLDGLVIGEGTIYPILSRFRKQGLVETSIEESPDGPARKYYRLTPQGRSAVALMNEVWDKIHLGVCALRGEQK
jgi:PadR family transcriptional regulator, regulatory protein PadR